MKFEVGDLIKFNGYDNGSLDMGIIYKIEENKYEVFWFGSPGGCLAFSSSYINGWYYKIK